jgi:glutamate racemase
MVNHPIGIFDSGVGGLTVFKAIRKNFPEYDIVYLGDTARFPYGTKSKSTIIDYSIQNATFLLQQGVEVIIIACNTASAIAFETLTDMFSIPIIGVISAGANKALKTTKNGRIGVIGTEGTINSHAYYNAINKLDKSMKVFEYACPLLVSLAEENWLDNDVTNQVIEIYLTELLKKKIDTLVLGCTHYPILKKAIGAFCGKGITLVDSADEIALEMKRNLYKMIENKDNIKKKMKGKNYFYVSDNEEKFKQIAQNILDLDEINLCRVVDKKSWVKQ